MRLRKRASYPRGVCPAGRRYAMKRQLSLLEKALAPWPRRQAPLLEINCGNGAFLEFLWQCGFDVQGTETDPSLREKAAAARVPGLEIFAAADDDLPFDNDSFDWVILHLKAPDSMETNIAEGTRLARRGFMLTFWNSSSFPALCWRSWNKKEWAPCSAPWKKAWELMRAMEMGRIASLSTLALPGCMWRDPWPGGTMSMFGVSLGAWCVIRLDMGASRPVTPQPLRLDATLSPPAQAIIEYTQKSSGTVKKP